MERVMKSADRVVNIILIRIWYVVKCTYKAPFFYVRFLYCKNNKAKKAMSLCGSG